MTTELMKEIKRLNANIEWLKSSQPAAVSNDLITMKEAMQLLNRQRTWVQVRMVKDLNIGQDADSHLVRDVDWIREGNRVMFKRDSIRRLKDEVLTAIGNKYDNI